MDKKFDKLDALILLAGDVLIEEALAYAREVLNPDLTVSKRTDRRIRKYIRYMQKKRTYHPAWEAMKRAAVVILVIGTVLFASAMSIEAVREKFWNAIVEWYEDYIAVLFVDDTAEDTLMDVEFEVREPSYLPTKVIKANQTTKAHSCNTVYYYNNQEAIRIDQRLHSENDIKIDNTNCILFNIKINEYDGLLIKYTGGKQYYTLVWKDEQYSYRLTSILSFITEEDILKMATSVYTQQ